MIVYLESNDKGKDIVFTQVIGDREEIRKKINNSKYGNSLDKYCLRKYLSESMLLNQNGFNESMFCDPNDIMKEVDIDFDKLEEIFNDIDYNNFIKNAEVFATRLLILKQDVMPYVNFKEINRISYDEGFYNESFEKMLKLNTEILKIMDTRKTIEYNFDEENVQYILNDDSMFDKDYTYRPVEVYDEKTKKLKRD